MGRHRVILAYRRHAIGAIDASNLSPEILGSGRAGHTAEASGRPRPAARRVFAPLPGAVALLAMTRTGGQPPERVLFLLDEFGHLGRMRPVERDVGLVGGYGVTFWLLVQDVSRLKGTPNCSKHSLTEFMDRCIKNGRFCYLFGPK